MPKLAGILTLLPISLVLSGFSPPEFESHVYRGESVRDAIATLGPPVQTAHADTLLACGPFPGQDLLQNLGGGPAQRHHELGLPGLRILMMVPFRPPASMKAHSLGSPFSSSPLELTTAKRKIVPH